MTSSGTWFGWIAPFSQVVHHEISIVCGALETEMTYFPVFRYLHDPTWDSTTLLMTMLRAGNDTNIYFSGHNEDLYYENYESFKKIGRLEVSVRRYPYALRMARMDSAPSDRAGRGSEGN